MPCPLCGVRLSAITVSCRRSSTRSKGTALLRSHSSGRSAELLPRYAPRNSGSVSKFSKRYGNIAQPASLGRVQPSPSQPKCPLRKVPTISPSFTFPRRRQGVPPVCSLAATSIPLSGAMRCGITRFVVLRASRKAARTKSASRVAGKRVADQVASAKIEEGVHPNPQQTAFFTKPAFYCRSRLNPVCARPCSILHAGRKTRNRVSLSVPDASRQLARL